nr:hypothetical protein CFP56_75476 [Quercus suber]
MNIFYRGVETDTLIGVGVVKKVEVEVEMKEYKHEELVKALENFENRFYKIMLQRRDVSEQQCSRSYGSCSDY